MTTLDPARTARIGSLDIAYDARVLEPRAWTVLQSDWAVELLGTAPGGPVLELCTGAGHIGLLVAAGTDREVVAVDLDATACGFARANAEAAGVSPRFEVREGAMDAVLRPEERFALVVADPPWVPSSDVGRFPEDPLLAIDGGADGLGVARACLEVASRHLRPGGSLLLQLGQDDQADRLLAGDAHGTWVDAGRRRCPRGLVLRLVLSG